LSTPKTIFIATHQQFTVRYLLQTDILNSLKERGHRIVIVSPNANDEEFREDYQRHNVLIEPFNYEAINKIRKRRIYQYLLKTRRYTLPGNLDLTTLKIKQIELHNNLQGKRVFCKFVRLLPIWLSHLLRYSRLLRRTFVRIETLLCLRQFHRHLFMKYKPDILILADLGTIDISNFIMHEARVNNVPIVSVILSWDNLTSKGIGVVKPDYAVAWNENMKWELENYHEIPSSRIFTGGIPIFDGYFSNGFLFTESKFRKTLGLSKNRKLILYGTSSPRLFRENLRIVHLMIEAIRNGQIAEQVQLIVRVHPAYLIRCEESDAKELRLIQDLSSEYSDILFLSIPELMPRDYGYEITSDNQRLLGSMLKYSNVLITQFSTLMLEAAILDTPVINIGFDGFANSGMKSCVAGHSITHLKRVLDVGFARTAKTCKFV